MKKCIKRHCMRFFLSTILYLKIAFHHLVFCTLFSVLFFSYKQALFHRFANIKVEIIFIKKLEELLLLFRFNKYMIMFEGKEDMGQWDNISRRINERLYRFTVVRVQNCQIRKRLMWCDVSTPIPVKAFSIFTTL